MNIEERALKNVINLIVEDAVNIYISATVNLMHLKEGTRKFRRPDDIKKNCLEAIYDVETFFLSDYGSDLTGLDGSIMLKKLNEYAKRAYRDVVNGNPAAIKRYNRKKFIHENRR